jgi:hypothetical protein
MGRTTGGKSASVTITTHINPCDQYRIVQLKWQMQEWEIATCVYMSHQTPPGRRARFQRNTPANIRERSAMSVPNEERIATLVATIWVTSQKPSSRCARNMVMSDRRIQDIQY